MDLKIKLSGIKDLAQARFAAGLGVEYISLHLDAEDDNALSPLEVPELVQWIKGPEIIAYLGRPNIERIDAFSELLHLKIIEIDADIFNSEIVYKPKIWLRDTTNNFQNKINLAGCSQTKPIYPSAYQWLSIEDAKFFILKEEAKIQGYDIELQEDTELDLIAEIVEKLRKNY